MRILAAVLLAFTAVPGQLPCPHEGSAPVPGLVEAGPPLGCRHAPGWPAWHLWTPAHREVRPRIGFRQGEAAALPRLLLRWRCTGSLLVPAVPAGLSTMGYVLDVEERPCQPPLAVTP